MWTLGKITDFSRLPVIHPSHIEFHILVFCLGCVQQTVPAGRPSRKITAGVARGERAVIGAIEVHNPEVGSAPVVHDIHGPSHVHNLPAIRRYLGVRDIFKIEDILKGKAIVLTLYLNTVGNRLRTK